MSDFLSGFYESPVAEKRTGSGKRVNVKRIINSMSDVVVSDFFLHREARDTLISALLLKCVFFAVITGTLLYKKGDVADKTGFLWQIFSGRIYYAISILIVLMLLIPFFFSYERREHSTSVAAKIASLVALNVAGRAAFFMFSDFKPVYAITIISGISLGGLGGFMTGALTMLVSNFLFGQGPWTPWQMLALGLIGFISGFLTERKWIPVRRLPLSLYGFFMAVVVYGGIMNPAAMLLSVPKPSVKLLIAYYVSGLPVDLVKGVATFLFLWVAAGWMLKKIERIG